VLTQFSFAPGLSRRHSPTGAQAAALPRFSLYQATSMGATIVACPGGSRVVRLLRTASRPNRIGGRRVVALRSARAGGFFPISKPLSNVANAAGSERGTSVLE